MKSKNFKKFATPILCACLCATAGFTLFACDSGKPKLEKIQVDTQEATVEFITGENFSTDGIVVKATYSDKKVKVVTDYTAQAKHEDITVNEDEQFTVAGTYTVTITYGKKSTNYSVEVSEPAPAPAINLTTGYETKVNEATQYLSTTLYNKSSTLHDDIYSAETLQQEVEDLQFFVEIADLENFDSVESVTFGEQTYNSTDKVYISIGHNHFIYETPWKVEANKLFVVAPILKAELSLNSTFKVNDTEKTLNFAKAEEGELTGLTTALPNRVNDFQTDISEIFVGDPSTPFYFHFDDKDSEYVFTKCNSEYFVDGEPLESVQYGVSTLDGKDTFGLIIEWGKQATEIYESLNDVAWTYSIFVDSTVYTTDLYILVEDGQPRVDTVETLSDDLDAVIENLNTVVYPKSSTLDQDNYTIEALKEKIQDAEFYVEVGEIKNYSEPITTLTIGEQTYNSTDKVYVSIGHNHFIYDEPWKVENNKLYVAGPVLKTEMMLNIDDIFMLNDEIEIWNDIIPSEEAENFTSARTSGVNAITEAEDGWDITLKDTKIPFYFEFGAEEANFVTTKLVKHYKNGNTEVQYGITPLEEDFSYGTYIKYGKTIAELYEQLNAQTWELTMVTKINEEDVAYSANLHFTLEQQ